MKTIPIIQMCAGLAAIAALVAADMLGASLSAYAHDALIFVVGWVIKRPADMLPAAKA